MVHSFRCADLNLLLDVESGALHVVSDEAQAVCERFLQGEDKARIAAALPQIDAQTVAECYDALCALRDGGELLTPCVQEGTLDDGGIVKALCLHVAHDCNLRCGYCFASTGAFEGTRSLMSAEVGEAALEFLMAHSGQRTNLEVDFFGGEPMMNFEVVKHLVRYGRALEKRHGKIIHFTMTTNCYELPDDAVAFCNEEMHNLVLSLDGRAEVHDALRPTEHGGDSYAQSVRNALALIEHRGDKDYYARGTFTRHNLDFVPDALALFDAGFEHVSLEPVVLERSHPLSLREQDLPALFAAYEALLAALCERRERGLPHHFFHFTVDLSGGPCLRKRLSGCGAGREYLAVTPEGDLYPCHQFVGRDGYVIGSVFEGIKQEGVREAFTHNHVGEKAACAQCFAKYMCAGGCAANAQAYAGNLLTPNPLECALMKKRTECALAFAALQAMA